MICHFKSRPLCFAVVFVMTAILLSQTAWSEGASTDVATLKDGPDCPELVVIPAGAFVMGSPESEEGHEAGEIQHRVTISKAFAMGKYPVTKGEFRQFIRESGYAAEWKCFSLDEQGNMGESERFTWETPGFDQTDNEPVACVDALDAEAYALWLSAKTGKSYRLPTEAEYEYAVRAGTTTSRYWGDSQDDGCAYANGHGYESEKAFFGKMTQCDDGYIYTSPVGSYRPNAFGLRDMLGNVWVWLADCWHETYDDGPDSEAAVSFPECTERVMRGGSYISHFTSLRAAARHKAEIEARFHNYGIRIVRDLTSEEIGGISHPRIQ